MKRLLSVALAAIFVASVLVVPADARHIRHHHHHHHVHKIHYKKKHRTPRLPPVVVAKIDVSSQTMSVTVNGFSYAYWRVSTARSGYHTPHGTFGVSRMAAVYYSRKYDNSPMPHSVFFSGGNAIHGSYHIKQLGYPASHGCVRLAPNNAATLYSLVQKFSPRRTRIVVTE